MTNNVSKLVLPDCSYSKGYKIQSGVRQGDPISLLLFVLSIEPLIRAINNPNIKGTPLHKIKILASQIASKFSLMQMISPFLVLFKTST
jgi:hypothetical protein